jgi:hypothetical protein
MVPALAALRTFWRMCWADQQLVVEATLSLATAALLIAVLPFRHVGRLAGRPVAGTPLSQGERTTAVRRIRWAIVVCAGRVPWRAVCFQQSLAAQWMLRRRGVASVLYYGAAPDRECGLAAHVWVMADEVGVVGHEIAHKFAILATYPPEMGQNPSIAN